MALLPIFIIQSRRIFHNESFSTNPDAFYFIWSVVNWHFPLLSHYSKTPYFVQKSNIFGKFTHCLKSSFFVQKLNFDIPRKLSIFWGVKNSWKCCGFGLLSCWQLWFHEKNCQKKFGWKTRQNVRVLSKLNFGQKFAFLNSVLSDIVTNPDGIFKINRRRQCHIFWNTCTTWKMYFRY